MKQFKNSFEIYKLLNKSNCKECGERTCLAFSGKVFHEQNQLSDCPHVDQTTLKTYGGSIIGELNKGENNIENVISKLKQEIRQIDLPSIANEIGGFFSEGKLALKVFGKDFYIHPNGEVSSDLHLNYWIIIPLLKYTNAHTKVPLTGKWISFRELTTGNSRYPLFRQRSELPMSKIAETYTGLFEDLILVFNGRQVENHNGSDISLVVHPLPMLPILISYWKPEEGFESNFNFLFDSSAEQNLEIEQINTICSGIAIMFQKLSIKHS
jgi:hypothetical protein